MRKIKLERFPYRFADKILEPQIKKEVERILEDSAIDLSMLTPKKFNSILDELFVNAGWERQPAVFDESDAPSARMDFLKNRVGIEVAFGHPSFIGIDLLKFQVASYSELNKIDVGIYIVATKNFQKEMKWDSSLLSYKKVKMYLPYFKSAIQVPIYVIGVDL